VPGTPAQARTQAQADDIDGVTWLEGDAVPGSIVSVRLEDVVEDYDFRATVMRTLDEPRTSAAPRRRPLPMAGVAGTAAFGRPFGA
jgi:hypothetical protein